MKIATPREIAPGERRVALTPDGVKELLAKSAQVAVESSAGEGAYIPDVSYSDAGAVLASCHEIWGQAEMILKVLPPSIEEIGRMKPGSWIASFLQPTSNPEIVQALCKQGINSFAMDMMPRISRAQSMDVLSSMSTIAGYKAALISAELLPKFFPMFMTAAGTLPPSRVFVIGAGVAGLQAIATTKRLGAIVEAFDVRPAVKEQIESLGGKFVGLSLVSDEAEDAGGYAKEVTADTHARELELIASRLPHVDVVITTALIPGRRAPLLITAEMLSHMRPGSVVVDLAAPAGGNCEATVPGQTIVSNGVTVVGRTDLLASMSSDASRMYSKNMTSFLGVLLKEGELALDFEDEIVKGTLITHDGKIVHDVTRMTIEKGGSQA